MESLEGKFWGRPMGEVMTSKVPTTQTIPIAALLIDLLFKELKANSAWGKVISNIKFFISSLALKMIGVSERITKSVLFLGEGSF